MCLPALVAVSASPLIFLVGLVAVFASFGLLFLLSPFAASCVGCRFVGCGGVAYGLFGHVSLPLRFSNFGIVLPVWALVSMIVHIPLTIIFLCFCVVPFSYLPLVGRVRGAWFSSLCLPNSLGGSDSGILFLFVSCRRGIKKR